MPNNNENNSNEIYKSVIDSVDLYSGNPYKEERSLDDLYMSYKSSDNSLNDNQKIESVESNYNLNDIEKVTLKQLDSLFQNSKINQLIDNEITSGHKEIKDFYKQQSDEINKFKNYIDNNTSEIIDKYNLQEGYNSQTGSIENYDTLIGDFTYSGTRQIQEEMYYNLSDEAKNILKQSTEIKESTIETGREVYETKLNYEYENENDFDSLNIKNRLSKYIDNYDKIQNDIEKISSIQKKDLSDINYSLNDDMNGIKIYSEKNDSTYTVIHRENFESEPIIENNIINPLNNQNNSDNIDNEIANKLGYLTDDNGTNDFSNNQNEPIVINEIGHNKVKNINNYPINFKINNKNYKYTVSSTKAPKEFIKHIENNNSAKNILHSDLKHSVLKQDQSKNLKTNQTLENNDMKNFEDFKKEHEKKQTKEQSL
ncbi:hypothetical protein [Mammaliicoccus sciuri]|uniref:hypothetical protein n=1 Tax=Mammaliicoccus sciuri TaxID=1296 RepID=UPI001F218419|nr:hypothetical protein [Mammaliicoccus sciuri]MCE5086042.1 hypothetical protein [Mammaliicoccus sciuri]